MYTPLTATKTTASLRLKQATITKPSPFRAPQSESQPKVEGTTKWMWVTAIRALTTFRNRIGWFSTTATTIVWLHRFYQEMTTTVEPMVVLKKPIRIKKKRRTSRLTQNWSRFPWNDRETQSRILASLRKNKPENSHDNAIWENPNHRRSRRTKQTRLETHTSDEPLPEDQVKRWCGQLNHRHTTTTVVYIVTNKRGRRRVLSWSIFY